MAKKKVEVKKVEKPKVEKKDSNTVISEAINIDGGTTNITEE